MSRDEAKKTAPLGARARAVLFVSVPVTVFCSAYLTIKVLEWEAATSAEAASAELPEGEAVFELARDGNQRAVAKLLSMQNEAQRQNGMTTETRKEVLDTFFDIEDLPKRLHAVLDFAAADETPVSKDPLFDHAVDRMSRTWLDHPDRLQQGRDLMLLENRPRARQLLAMGLSRAAESGVAAELAETTRHAFAGDLVDVYFEEESVDYRPDLERGVRALAGNDAARLLAHGVDNVDFNDLEIAGRDKQLLNRALDDLAAGRPLLSEEN